LEVKAEKSLNNQPEHTQSIIVHLPLWGHINGFAGRHADAKMRMLRMPASGNGLNCPRKISTFIGPLIFLSTLYRSRIDKLILRKWKPCAGSHTAA
jgi:hypothetical protein